MTRRLLYTSGSALLVKAGTALLWSVNVDLEARANGGGAGRAGSTFGAALSARVQSAAHAAAGTRFTAKISGWAKSIAAAFGFPALDRPSRQYVAAIPRQRFVLNISPQNYIASLRIPLYTATPLGPTMPQAPDLSNLDAVDQVQTIPIDFGRWLPEGVTLTGSPIVRLSVVSGPDASPATRLVGSAIIGTALAPHGSNRNECAIMQQVGNLVAGTKYLIFGKCGTSQGDTVTGWTHFTAVQPA